MKTLLILLIFASCQTPVVNKEVEPSYKVPADSIQKNTGTLPIDTVPAHKEPVESNALKY